MNAVLQVLSNIPQLRNYFIHELLPRGEQVPLGNQLLTRADTIECLKSLSDKNLMKTLEEEDMYVISISIFNTIYNLIFILVLFV